MRSWAVRLVPLAVLPALVAALAGCQSARKADPDATPSRKPVVAGDRYVALGDSYTSAPAVGEPTGPPACQQTDRNYPHLLAEALDLDLVDVSCGGAKTPNMTTQPQVAGTDRLPPQVEAVTEDTALVTISIGANNGSVYGNLVIRCAQLALADPDGAPCSDLAQQNDDVLPAVFDGVVEGIVETVDAVLERAPDARVVVVGYPQIFPAEGTCPELPLAEGDYPFGRGVIEAFVQAQARAATESGAEYVDVWAATEGHDICADEPWIAGFEPAKAATPYHPYAEEQEAVAGLLEDLVARQG